MTLPTERYYALRQVPIALVKLCEPGERVSKATLRHTVRWLLKHYPGEYDLERMRDKCKGILR